MSNNKIIPGVWIYYYFVCRRKLWYFVYGITMEEKSELVNLGKILHEIFRKREKTKELKYFRIKVDFIKRNIIVEFKKSKKLGKAAEWQLKYYLWVLGLNKGILKLGKEKLEITLKENDIELLKRVIKEIKEIITKNKPPSLIRKNYCKNCAYILLCYS